MNSEEKTPDLEKSSESEVVREVITPLSRLKQERYKKKEKKKAIRALTTKFGDVKLAKKMVKSAIRTINRRTAGRGR
jgi:hypothetical protein